MLLNVYYALNDWSALAPYALTLAAKLEWADHRAHGHGFTDEAVDDLPDWTDSPS